MKIEKHALIHGVLVHKHARFNVKANIPMALLRNNAQAVNCSSTFSRKVSVIAYSSIFFPINKSLSYAFADALVYSSGECTIY